MFPAIENPNNLDCPVVAEQIIKTMFANYRRVVIRQELGGGFSGGRVLEVQPIQADGTPELPVVVKLATISLIQKEWLAYQQHIHRRLPYIAQVSAEPVLLPDLGWGGLRYTLMGGATFEVISLRDYCARADSTDKDIHRVLERLLKIMRHLWRYNEVNPQFQLRAGYDRLLPVNLLIQHQPTGSVGQPYIITPDLLPVAPLQVGDHVHVSGFAISKVNPVTQTVTFNRPQPLPNTPAYFLRCRSSQVEQLVTYQANQIMEPFEGEIIETRMSRLHAEIQRALGESYEVTAPMLLLPDQSSLPNPLLALDSTLNVTRGVKLAVIHGDFHLENILIEPETGMISLIDFADAHQNHILHDFLRLETEVTTKLIPEILYRHNLSPLHTLASFYWQLHCTDFKGGKVKPSLPHPDLQKPWSMLTLLRQTAREYFLEADDSTEYYQGLMIYLLGALKLKNLNTVPEAPLPKQAAFWTAALVHLFLTTPGNDPDTPPPPLAPIIAAQLQTTTMPGKTAVVQSTGPTTQAEAERRLAAMPLDVIPTLAPIPPHSRMLLSRNPLFVGRRRDLKTVARTLKGGETVAIGQIETAAATGLGGIGKTQLASEFVHRYGQFFAGGVFWLSFADPKAVPAEIAACGRVGVLELHPDYEDHSLEEQVQLVMAAWQSPLPRLLIFDNCEDPELLAQWRPSSGGCRILVTSRRADWEATLGVQSLPLDVLSRPESITLLREHQPDADDKILNTIAEELGDLPLALHLAGSYMARYRRTITPAQYLKQLSDPALLQHHSLKGVGVSPTGHFQNIHRAIALSYDQLDPNNNVDA